MRMIEAEKIQFREVSSENTAFVGALTSGNNGQLYIMVNQGIDNPGRSNFTIAHKLGHYFLAHRLQSNTFYCCEGEIVEEIQALALLMPEKKVKSAFLSMLRNPRKAKFKDFLHVKNDYTFSIWCGIRQNLTTYYGVSEAALRYLLKQLNLDKFDFSRT